MEKIAIVTDSTCDISQEELAAHGIFCIDLKVIKPDGESFPSENSPENTEAFYDYIETCDELPSTSMPSPLEFGDLYSELAVQGYTHALSVHISTAMSGTCSSARMAAQSAPLIVEVIDSKRNTLPLALMVFRLAELRDQGLGFAELVERAQGLSMKTGIFFALDTLKNLVKGGRAGKATGLAASLLDIKPILTVDDDGQVAQTGMARSMKRALPKLADKAEEVIEHLGPLEGYFVHARNLPAVETLRAIFEERGIAFRELGVRQVGPVIATHVATGVVGFAYIAAET